MDFKIIFPSGYHLTDDMDDETEENIDINIIFRNGNVFFATLFTLLNLDFLLNRYDEPCFWATDMLIVKDLHKTTIKKAIKLFLDEGHLEFAFTNIGSIEKCFPGITFEEIPDMANGYDLNLDDS